MSEFYIWYMLKYILANKTGSGRVEMLTQQRDGVALLLEPFRVAAMLRDEHNEEEFFLCILGA